MTFHGYQKNKIISILYVTDNLILHWNVLKPLNKILDTFLVSRLVKVEDL